MNFGAKLKELRKTKNLSQELMAEKLHMTQGNYSMYESNQRTPTIDIIQRVVETFDVELQWLIDAQKNKVVLESGNTNNGNGLVKTENYYAVPKDLLDKFIELL
jgi:transcriptional regulator with XRE-family HTH domain